IRDLLIKGETQEASSYPNEIGHSSHAKAFYDNLKEHFSEAMNNVDERILVAEVPLEYGRRQEVDLLTQTVLSMVKIFQEASKKPDWENNSDIRNKIEGQIDDLFWEMEDEYGLKFANSDELLATIQQIGIKNYG
ncbi:MAG: hypothetical protein LGB68_06155, partial [Sulfurovum sp.]|nr:hypothetical protein [Sulfurovum sp.]